MKIKTDLTPESISTYNNPDLKWHEFSKLAEESHSVDLALIEYKINANSDSDFYNYVWNSSFLFVHLFYHNAIKLFRAHKISMDQANRLFSMPRNRYNHFLSGKCVQMLDLRLVLDIISYFRMDTETIRLMMTENILVEEPMNKAHIRRNSELYTKKDIGIQIKNLLSEDHKALDQALSDNPHIMTDIRNAMNGKSYLEFSSLISLLRFFGVDPALALNNLKTLGAVLNIDSDYNAFPITEKPSVTAFKPFQFETGVDEFLTKVWDSQIEEFPDQKIFLIKNLIYIFWKNPELGKVLKSLIQESTQNVVSNIVMFLSRATEFTEDDLLFSDFFLGYPEIILKEGMSLASDDGPELLNAQEEEDQADADADEEEIMPESESDEDQIQVLKDEAESDCESAAEKEETAAFNECNSDEVEVNKTEMKVEDTYHIQVSGKQFFECDRKSWKNENPDRTQTGFYWESIAPEVCDKIALALAESISVEDMSIAQIKAHIMNLCNSDKLKLIISIQSCSADLTFAFCVN